MTYVVTEPCIDVKDKACMEECPTDAIYEGMSMSYIHPSLCIDCGACEPVCPVQAIFYEDDVPEQWAHFVDAGQDFANLVPNSGARGVQYDLDSSLIFAPEDPRRAARTATPANKTAAANKIVPSPFLLAPAGTRIAVLWGTRTVDVDVVKALLLAFDRVALITSDRLSLSGGSGRTDQWKTLESLGLVAHIGVEEAVAIIGTETLRALFDAVLVTGSQGRPSGRDWHWAMVLQAFRQLGLPQAEMNRAMSAAAGIRDLLAALICRLAECELATRGVTATAIISGRYELSEFTATLNQFATRYATVTLPPENVLPPCAEATIEQIVSAREAVSPAYRAYADLLTASMTALSRQPGKGRYSADYSPDEIADEARRLRRLLPDLPWTGRGYIGLGVVGSVCGTPPGTSADLLRAVNERLSPDSLESRPMAAFVVEPAEMKWI